jgi:hypothetical protein
MFRLEPHRDTLVGSADENIRGISGGERKVSITARWRVRRECYYRPPARSDLEVESDVPKPFESIRKAFPSPRRDRSAQPIGSVRCGFA